MLKPHMPMMQSDYLVSRWQHAQQSLCKVSSLPQPMQHFSTHLGMLDEEETQPASNSELLSQSGATAPINVEDPDVDADDDAIEGPAVAEELAIERNVDKHARVDENAVLGDAAIADDAASDSSFPDTLVDEPASAAPFAVKAGPRARPDELESLQLEAVEKPVCSDDDGNYELHNCSKTHYDAIDDHSKSNPSARIAKPPGIALAIARATSKSSCVPLSAPEAPEAVLPVYEPSRGLKRRLPKECLGSPYGEPSCAWFSGYIQNGGEFHGMERWKRHHITKDIELGKSVRDCIYHHIGAHHFSEGHGELSCIPYTSKFAKRLNRSLLPDAIQTCYLPTEMMSLQKEQASSTLRRCLDSLNALNRYYDVKIGFTGNPRNRIQSYAKQFKFDAMYLLHSSWEKGVSEMLEATLIEFCPNINRIGGGGGNSPGETGTDGPWWVYAVTQPKVGSLLAGPDC